MFESTTLSEVSQGKKQNGTSQPSKVLPSVYNTIDGKPTSARDVHVSFQPLSEEEGTQAEREWREGARQRGAQESPAISSSESLDFLQRRQEALALPTEVTGQELLNVMRTRLQAFQAYFERQWHGKMFVADLEKEADEDCIMALHSLISAQLIKMRMEQKAELLQKIDEIEKSTLGTQKSRADLQADMSAKGGTRKV